MRSLSTIKGMQVGVWQAWIFREEILAYLSTLMAHDDDVPASKPQAASPGKTDTLLNSPCG